VVKFGHQFNGYISTTEAYSTARFVKQDIINNWYHLIYFPEH